MIERFAILFAVLVFAGCHAASAPPVITITTTGDHLILAAWPSGHIVWSADPINGGPPLKCAEVPPQRVSETIEAIAAAHFFDADLARKYVGDGTQFTTITIRRTGQTATLESWHEQIEQSGRLIATARGVSALDAGTGAEVMMNQPPEYTRFRTVWDKTNAAAMKLIPASGTPCEMPALGAKPQ